MPDTKSAYSPKAMSGEAPAARIMAEAGEPVPVPEKALVILLEMACCAALDPYAQVGQVEAAVLLSMADALPEGEERAEVVALVNDTLRAAVTARLVATLKAAAKV